MDFNHRIIEEFRANGGRVAGPFAGTPMLLLHHAGAKSGVAHVTPLAYTPDGDGRYVIVASNGGSATSSPPSGRNSTMQHELPGSILAVMIGDVDQSREGRLVGAGGVRPVVVVVMEPGLQRPAALVL